ncbi:MAG: hypothetical protein JNN08_23560, partial [Bryobacterales bacterium]|nr:hypothetical protein [Bryobacterales bacterium]
WTHRSHVIMAACYLTAQSAEDVTPLIRDNIKKYNLSQGGENTDTSGYHESLTIFWIHVIDHFLRQLPASGSRLEKVKAAADHFGDRSKLFQDYWTFDVVKSVEARRAWVEPDRQPLP